MWDLYKNKNTDQKLTDIHKSIPGVSSTSMKCSSSGTELSSGNSKTASKAERRGHLKIIQLLYIASSYQQDIHFYATGHFHRLMTGKYFIQPPKNVVNVAY